jgi:hypothetical protein
LEHFTNQCTQIKELESFLKSIALKVPQERRWLERHVHLELDMGANTFATLMKKLVRDRRSRVRSTLIATGTGNRWPTKLFHIGPMKKAEREKCERRIRAREKLWNRKTVGDIGEIITRQVMIESQAFSNITQKKKLGKVNICNGILADIMATYEIKDGRELRLLVEVKNDRKVFMPCDDGQLVKLLEAAFYSNTQPVFVCSYANASAMEFFEKIGVAHHAFRRQFLPSAWRTEIERDELVPADLLDDYFEFIDPKRPIRRERLKAESRILEDIEAFSRPQWIEDANRQWQANLGIIPEIIHLLKNKKVRAVHDLLDNS